MSQYFIRLGVNHVSLCDYPYSRLNAGYRYNVAIIDIDGVSLLSLTSSYMPHCWKSHASAHFQNQLSFIRAIRCENFSCSYLNSYIRIPIVTQRMLV